MPTPNANLVQVVSNNYSDPIETLITQNQQIITLLTEIRDDQRSTLEDDQTGNNGNGNGNGKNTVRTANVQVSI